MEVARIRLAHEFVLDRTHSCAYPQGRRQYGLVYALEGEAEYRFRTGERLRLSAGEALLLSPCAAYTLTVERPFRHYTVNFDARVDRCAGEEPEALYVHLGREAAEPTEHLFRSLVGAWSAKDVGFEMRAMGYVYELLSLVQRSVYGGQSRARARRLQPARERIERRFGERVDLLTLATLCRMSVTSFRREWRQVFGASPMQYLDRVRLQAAVECLGSGYYTVSQIAARCGFEDVSYFVRFFKKHMGLTPGAYRKQAF